MKKYIDIKNPNRNANKIKIELYYNLGGMNYFTGKAENRGYYLIVTPVLIDGYFESVTAFTGIKKCIKEVSRKSEKAYQAALQESNKYLPELLNYVTSKNNIELVEE